MSICRFTVCISIVMCLSANSLWPGEISDRLQSILEQARPDEAVKVWVYFADKEETQTGYRKARAEFSPRAWERRRSIPLDWYDLPVNDAYIDAVRRSGGENVRPSRWLNAVSTMMTPDRIAGLAEETFVARIDPVRRYYRAPVPDVSESLLKPVIDSAEYGQSFAQNHQLGVDSLHALGLTGAGVLLAFLDTGYKTDHPAFDSLFIMDTIDFISGDSTVDDQIDLSQTGHGTATLSACGGFEEDSLVGPAYKASYLLYKTEIQLREIQIEEDNWVFAAERADLLGADIISSSLGYLDWYFYEDMDGNTAVTTVAADIAASRGILVVISAGNEGSPTNPWHYITAPADGDSVVAVAAVDQNGIIAGFSSYGPSYDGRQKPELSAMGVGTRCASISDGYTSKSGTSLSAPLIAGAAALVLEANPSLVGQPMAVRKRLIESADRYLNPDYRYGYGIPDAVLAAGFGLRIFPIDAMSLQPDQDTSISLQTIGPVGETVVFDAYDIPPGSVFEDFGDGTAALSVFGSLIENGIVTYHVAAFAGGYADTAAFSITRTGTFSESRVGPNPFRDSLFIYPGGAVSGGYKMEIFTLSGDLVFRARSSGNPYLWRATNEAGEKVASGAYIIRISADGIEEKIKVFKL